MSKPTRAIATPPGEPTKHVELTDREVALLEENFLEKRIEFEATKYKDLRKQEYADIGDQLDMMYWDLVNGTSHWKDHCESVKRKHPRPQKDGISSELRGLLGEKNGSVN